MKLTLIIGCSVAFGWFVRAAIGDAVNRIYDWRESARWAALAAICVIGVLIVF